MILKNYPNLNNKSLLNDQSVIIFLTVHLFQFSLTDKFRKNDKEQLLFADIVVTVQLVASHNLNVSPMGLDTDQTT